MICVCVTVKALLGLYLTGGVNYRTLGTLKFDKF